MKIRHILASTLLAGFAALGLAAGLKGARVERVNATTSFKGSIAVELQLIGSDFYWDKDSPKLIAKVYNTEDAGKMVNGWTEFVQMTEGTHRYILPYNFNVDPTGEHTKIDIYRVNPAVSNVNDVDGENIYNKVLNVSGFGDAIYVYNDSGNSAASSVAKWIGAKSQEWLRSWDVELHNVKFLAGEFQWYGDIALTATDEFKWVSGNDWSGAYHAHSSLSEIIVGDQTNNIGCSAADTYRMYTPSESKLYVTTVDLAEADEYALGFLSATSVCDPTGVVNNITSVIWSAQKTAFEALPSNTCRNYLKNADAKDAEHGGSYTEQAAARYVYIVEKYGSEAYEDFWGRYGGAVIPPKTNSFDSSIAVQGNSYFVIAVIVVTIAAIAAGSVIILHRRKEN